MRRLLDGLYAGGGILAGIFLVTVLALMMGMSLGRMVGVNIPSGDDFASWSMAAMTFLGLAYTFRSGDMIRVGLVIDRYDGPAKRRLELCVLTFSLAFISYFTWHALNFVLQSVRFNDMSTGVVSLPLWIPQLGFVSGLTLLTLALADELVHVAGGGLPRYEKPKPTTAEQVLEQALQSAV